MTRIVRTRLILGVAAGACLIVHPPGLAQQPPDAPVVPLKTASALATEKRIEAVRGDRTKAGAPFVIRIHAEAGYVIMPHVHPEDENIVVVKGSWALGMGDHFRKQLLEPMEVGDYGFAPKKMAHFAWSKSDTIIQVHGVGPFVVQWIVPIYDLTDRGVLVRATAEDPGRPASTTPQGCFSLNLGARAHANYGEGVVVEAQCTPGELTQYRVEKQGGQRFWAQRDELTTL